jgi:hypothetical protein
MRNLSKKTWVVAGALALTAIGGAAVCQTAPKPEDTEQWKPVPPVVTPGPAVAAPPPSDAIVLFDGKDLSQWVSTNTKGPAGWTVANGVFTVKKGAGNIETRRSFKNYQLHIEWQVPAKISGQGQGRGNSGLFLAGVGGGDGGYELQILDSYKNETYVNGQAGSIYKQQPPLANAMRPPGQWQTYDVVWIAPVFDASGAMTSPGRVTAFHNGVLIQNNTPVVGETVYIGKPPVKPYTTAPIKLQDHGDPSEPLSFRNIWIRELP